MAQTGHDVCASDAKQFLVSVETIAVLDREHAAKSGRFHHAEKKTTQRERQQVVQVRQMYRWKPEWWQPLWHLAQQFHAQATEIHTRSNDDAGDHNE